MPKNSLTNWEDCKALINGVRESRGKSFADLAFDLGRSKQQVYDWFSGKREPGANYTVKLLEWAASKADAGQRQKIKEQLSLR